ncbi:MAG: mechanosensitive ion channel family protein [Vampirovibrionales bacterium]|nr:mechanosensitive ion channel family protein [Vampirovibrionales bacterium]
MNPSFFRAYTLAPVSALSNDLSPWLPSLWNLGIWLLVGLLVDLVFLRLVYKAAEKTAWELDDAIIRCFFGKTFAFFALFGIDTAVALLPRLTRFEIISSAKPIAHQLIVSIVILLLAWLISDMAIRFIQHLNKRFESLPSTSIFHNIIRIGIMCLGLLVMLQTLGISVLPILTALGVGGLAISLALKDTLENVFAGFQIIFSKQIRIGDYVRLDNGVEGYAEDIGWRNSTIRQFNENLVIIPNAKLASAIVTNYSRPNLGMLITLEGIVHYHSDLQEVESLILEAAQRVIDREEMANKSKKPVVRLFQFTDLGVRYRLRVAVSHYKNEFPLTHVLLQEVHKTLHQAGIGFSNIATPAPLPPPPHCPQADPQLDKDDDDTPPETPLKTNAETGKKSSK